MKRVFAIFSALILALPAFLFVYGIDEESIAKKKAADDYRANLVATTITTPEELGWTGNEKKCKPGKVSHDTYVKVVKRINYFRRLAGVSDNIVLDSAWNKYAQAAALIMYANKELNHNPNPGMKCYSTEGKTGASSSNLSLFNGVSIEAIIRDEIEDGGESNASCGHRRWLLSSGACKFGFGATPESYAVRDFATEAENDTSTFHGTVPEYFAYPFKGYVPYEVVYPKWSFSVPGKTDFSKATVEVSGAGKPVICKVINRGGANYGDPTLVWTVNGIKEEFYYQSLDASGTFFHYYDMNEKRKAFVDLGLLNKKLTVKISNVMVEGKSKSYTYSFTIIDPDEWK